MRRQLIILIATAGCTQDANHLGNPLMLPVSGVSTMFQNAAYDTRRGEVEVLVKSNHEAILSDIRADGGPNLSEAMDAARIPNRDRPTRLIQLQSDIGWYETAPGALVTALMVYGS